MRTFASANKFYLSVALTVLLFYFSIILIFSRTLLDDGDTLWHIRTGQWILEQKQVPTVDIYSYTALGRRWISTEWLAEIFFALAFKIGGWRGVVILSVLTCSAIIAIICFYLLQKLRFSVAIGWTALTALAISPHFLARPHLFSYVAASIWVITLVESYDRDDFRSSMLWLCVVMVVWANLHPSFTFGLALLYVFIGYSCYEKVLRGEYSRCKNELFVMIAASSCALLTPYGVYSGLLTLQTMDMKFALQHVNEWRPPDYQQNKIHLLLIVGLLMAIAGLGVRLHGPRLIAYGMMLILALSYTRGLGIFYLLTPIILARPLSECATWCRAAQVGASSWSAGSSQDPVLLYLHKRPIMVPMIFLMFAVLATAASWRQLNIGPPSSVVPKEALDFVRKAGIMGNVFNSYNFGGALIFSEIPAFIDSRTPPYTDDFLRQSYEIENLLDGEKSAFRLLDDYKVEWVIVRPKVALARALTESNLWDQVYSDKYAVVLVRHR
jgi:hypothetical protein